MNEFAPPQRPSRKTLVLSLIGLAAFLAVEALLLRHFIRVDTRPPSWEQSSNLEIAHDYHDAGAGLGGLFTLAPKPPLPPYPPAYHWLISGAYDSKDPVHAALWVNWFYMAVLALSLFAICWRFLPDHRALAGTLAFCAAPGLQDLLTTQLPDLAIVALVSAGYWALLESDGFTFWLPSLGFAAIFGAGMLHKWSYAAYMVPAYVIGLRALSDRRARLQVLAAAVLALALFLPWYASHLSLLPAWFARAWAMGGEPFWKDGQWAAYLVGSCGELGPLLWALGLISLLAPQYARRRENAWVLGYWVVFSYVIWTVIPDRQMRFVFPGFIPLGLAMAATWPGAVTWSVTAVQLVCAINFFFGAVGPLVVPTPLAPMTFLTNRPPLRADWKLPEIIARIQATRDPSRAVASVALIANDDFFNPESFRWTQKRLNAPEIVFRGSNARGTELSEFVLLKQGRLGPENLVAGFAPAVKLIADPDGWFQTEYETVEKWPLPDRSTAVLYRQRRGRARPPGGKRLAYLFFEAGKTQIKNLNVDLGAWDAAPSAFPIVMASADQITNQGMVIRGVTADLGGFSFVPMYEGGMGDYDWNDIRLTRLDRLVIRSLQVDADDLRPLLEKRAPGLKITAITLDGTVKLSGMWKDRPVEAEASLELDRPAKLLRLKILSASYMGVAIPPAFFLPIQELNVSLEPTADRPYSVELPGITVRGGRLTIP